MCLHFENKILKTFTSLRLAIFVSRNGLIHRRIGCSCSYHMLSHFLVTTHATIGQNYFPWLNGQLTSIGNELIRICTDKGLQRAIIDLERFGLGVGNCHPKLNLSMITSKWWTYKQKTIVYNLFQMI